MTDNFAKAAHALAEAVLTDAEGFRAYMVGQGLYEAADALDALMDA